MEWEPELFDCLFNNTTDNNTNEQQSDLFDSLFGEFDSKTPYPAHTIHNGKYATKGCQQCAESQSINLDPIISDTADTKPSISNSNKTNNDIIDLFDWTIPYHNTHHHSQYADIGCEQCIKQRNIPYHTAHYRDSEYALLSCELCLTAPIRYPPTGYHPTDNILETERKHWISVYEKKMKEWECNTERDWRKQNLITFGYIRRMEKRYKFNYDVPNGVKQIVSTYVEILEIFGRKKNLRQLIHTLQNVLPKWKPIEMTKLLTTDQVKKGYYKCVRVVHPDKSIGRGDDVEIQVICSYIFAIMESAFNRFYDAL
eukprot:363623_1